MKFLIRFQSLAVVIAFMSTLVLSAVLTIAAAKILTSAEYSKFSSFLSLLVILFSTALSTQAVVARESHPEKALISSSLLALKVVNKSSFQSGILLLLISTCSSLFLGVSPVVASIALITTLIGQKSAAIVGYTQTTSSQLKFSIYLAIAYAPGYVTSLLFLIFTKNQFASSTGFLIGIALGFTTVYLMARVEANYQSNAKSMISKELLQSFRSYRFNTALSVLSFTVFINLDVLIANSLLQETDAGAYILFSQITKIIVSPSYLFVLLVFKTLIGQVSYRRIFLILSLVNFSGAVILLWLGVLVSKLDLNPFPNILYEPYKNLLGAFAYLGILLATIQFLVYFGIAQNSRISLIVGLGALSLFLACYFGAHSVHSLLLIFYSVTVILLFVLSIFLFKARSDSLPFNAESPK